jgi:hypothetical protein
MSVSEEDSGVFHDHIAAIESVAMETDSFIFLRCSEPDTAALIGLGLATKSVDIHSKSSNWGPMAGMVPVDAAFSKKGDGIPVVGRTPVADPHHPAALPLPLVLENRVFEGFTQTKLSKMAQAPTGALSAPGDEWYTAIQGIGPAAGYCFRLTPTPSGRAVCWVDSSKPTMNPEPLHVWHYFVEGVPKPVTGDYDLWMIAPHISLGRRAGHTAIIEVPLARQGEGSGVLLEQGATQTTQLMVRVIADLNKACNRTSNPVFNHGAEAQNLLFTQPIDTRVAMFTPSGGSRIVSAKDLPGILAECQSRGYLVYTNRQYLNTDPMISGVKSAKLELDVREGEARLHAAYSAIKQVAQEAVERSIDSQPQVASGVRHATELLSEGRAKLDAHLAAAAKMVEFGRSLNGELSHLRTQFSALKPTDFPDHRRAAMLRADWEVVRGLNEIVSRSTTERGLSTGEVTTYLRNTYDTFAEMAHRLGFSMSSPHFDLAWSQLAQQPGGRGEVLHGRRAYIEPNPSGGTSHHFAQPLSQIPAQPSSTGGALWGRRAVPTGGSRPPPQ